MADRRFLKEFAAHARKVREGKNVTQAGLARKLEKDKQSIQRLESGNSNPTLLTLKDIADALEIPLKKLLDF